MTAAPNTERALAAIAAAHQWNPAELADTPGKWTHAFIKGDWRVLVAVTAEHQSRSGIAPLQPGAPGAGSSTIEVRRAPVASRIEAICVEPLGEQEAGGLEIPGLHDEIMYVQLESWMAYLGQERDAIKVGSAEYFVAVNEMSDGDKIDSWVQLAEYWPWTPAPYGYPRIHPEKFGYLTVRQARRREQQGLIAPQPRLQQEPRWRFPGLTVSMSELFAVFVSVLVFTGLTLALTSLISSDHLFLSPDLTAIVTLVVSLYVGPVRRAEARVLGVRHLPDAIEYVPWVYPPEEGEPGSIYTPTGDVGPDCAILVVAESICSGIQVKYTELSRVMTVAGTQLPDTEVLDLDEQLHSIAWAVAELVDLRAQLHAAKERCESSAAIEERATAGRIRREAVLRRVTALYGYEKRLAEEIDRRYTAGLDAIFLEHEKSETLDGYSALAQGWSPVTDVPDLTTPLGAAWMDEYAAAGIDGLLRSAPDIEIDLRHEDDAEEVIDAEVIDVESPIPTRRERTANEGEPHPLATLEQYLQWLRGYVARGGTPTHEMDCPFNTVGFLYASTAVTIYSDYEYGARGRNIILASDVELRFAFKDPAAMIMQGAQDLLNTRGLAHSHVYKMDHFVMLGSTLYVPIYRDPEFDEFRSDEIAIRMGVR
ncbi:hypothetical protein [Mycobacteroides abscessus]|uniref:hypothetical protein n=1 Tax=Mycobacteroides abscessus TaxID=36809 RepID=UPI000C26BB65|nr:hypothetical protein [Mycobacteroides abscessus]